MQVVTQLEQLVQTADEPGQPITKPVSTHTFEDRLRTIRHAQDAGMSVCCGGILGLGETIDDRLKMLEVISPFPKQ